MPQRRGCSCTWISVTASAWGEAAWPARWGLELTGNRRSTEVGRRPTPGPAIAQPRPGVPRPIPPRGAPDRAGPGAPCRPDPWFRRDRRTALPAHPPPRGRGPLRPYPTRGTPRARAFGRPRRAGRLAALTRRQQGVPAAMRRCCDATVTAHRRCPRSRCPAAGTSRPRSGSTSRRCGRRAAVAVPEVGGDDHRRALDALGHGGVRGHPGGRAPARCLRAAPGLPGHAVDVAGPVAVGVDLRGPDAAPPRAARVHAGRRDRRRAATGLPPVVPPPVVPTPVRIAVFSAYPPVCERRFA